MFGPLKKLFGKPTTELPQPAPPPPPVREAKPAAPASKPPVPGPANSTATVTPIEPSEPGDMLALPLRVIIENLPGSLGAVDASAVRGDLYLPTRRILEQLGQGSVKVSIAEIKEACPPGIFPDDSTHDQKLVELPLSEILPRINAALLPRRPSQKRVDVPAEVRNLFGPRGEPLPQPPPDKTIAPRPSTPGPTLKSTPASLPAAAAPGISMPTASRPSSGPAPAAKFGVPATPTPAPAAATAAPSTTFLTVPIEALIDAWPEPVRQEIAGLDLPDAAVALPIDKVEQGLKIGKLSFTWKQIAEWVKPSPIPPAEANQATLLEFPLNIIAPLFMAQHRSPKTQTKTAVGENIPDLFSGSMAGFKAATASASPVSATAAPSPLPKVQPQAPIPPAPPAPPKPPPPVSTPGPAPVAPKPAMPAAPTPGAPSTQKIPAPNIPLPTAPGPAATPMASPPSPEPGPRIPAPSVPWAAPPPPRQPEPLIPAPAPPPAFVPTAPVSSAAAAIPGPSVAPKPAGSVLGELFGQPGKHDWSPNEIVQKTCGLKGVSGAFIAMQDGLLVAAQLPSPLNSETIAAFLPQIFGRMGQYTNELHIGGLRSLTLGLENASWVIIKVSNLYFAAAGRPGEILPTAQLNTIAAELGRQTK